MSFSRAFLVLPKKEMLLHQNDYCYSLLLNQIPSSNANYKRISPISPAQEAKRVSVLFTHIISPNQKEETTMTNATATFEESLKVVTSVESRRDFATYVPRDGVSLNFLLKHLPSAKLHTRKKKRSKPIKTMYDLEAYVLELTSKWHCSFTELMKEHPEHKDSVVDTATYFVSFAYSTDVETILSALEKYRRKLRADDIFVWISILSINQHFGRKKGEKAAVVYPKSWFKQAFKECIPAIKNVLFVMSPLGKPVALQRLWCIYELYLSVSNQICSLDVILSEEDEQYLIDNLLINSQSVLTYINGVNAEKATSSNREQEQKLRKQIAEIPGGYAAIDEAVRKRLREWFAHAATGYIAEKKEDYRGDRTKYIRLLRTVTKMLLEAGRLDSALSLAKEDLEECKAFYGNEHEEYVSVSTVIPSFSAIKFSLVCHRTTMAMNNLAMVLVNMGKLEESIRLKEESLRIEKKVLGSDHPQYAYGLNNLGMLLRDQVGLIENDNFYPLTLDFILAKDMYVVSFDDSGKGRRGRTHASRGSKDYQKGIWQESPESGRNSQQLSGVVERSGRVTAHALLRLKSLFPIHCRVDMTRQSLCTRSLYA